MLAEAMHTNHYHEHIEVYYMQSGRCNFFIDDKTYEVMPGDVVLIPSNAIHKTNYGEEEHCRLLLEFSIHFISDEIAEQIPNIAHIYRNPMITREVLSLLKKIEIEDLYPDEFSAMSVQSYINLILLLLIRNKDVDGNTESKNAVIDSVVTFIKRNYFANITLSKISRLYYMSSEHMSRMFKRETGFGFNEYIMLVRLQHAERMLKEHTKASIAEIAYVCGFNDSNYFSNKFKSIYGLSPLRYRRENR